MCHWYVYVMVSLSESVLGVVMLHTRSAVVAGLLGVTSTTGAVGAALGVAPVSDTVTVGVSGSLEGMSKLSLKLPLTVGLKRTVSVRLSPGRIVCPEQPSVTMLKGAARGLATATVPDREVVGAVVGHGDRSGLTKLPIATVPKSRLVGDTEMSG